MPATDADGRFHDMRFVRAIVTAGVIAVFAAMVWLAVDLARIESERRLNDAVVDAIYRGTVTKTVSDMHYQTATVERSVCSLSSQSVSVVSVFKASDRLQGDTYRQVLQLRGLTRLSLTGETVVPDALMRLQRMSELRALDCWHCKIDGGKTHRDGPFLLTLDLSGSHVPFEALDALLSPGTIRELRLSGCDLDFTAGVMDLIVSKLPQLEALHLSRTNLSDESAARIAELRSLRELHLGETAITDRTLRSIAQLESLATLNVFNTDVSDVGIRGLADSESLRKLVISRCPRVTKDGVAWLTEANPKLTVWSSHHEP